MLYLNECGIVCPLGDTHDAIATRLLEHASSGVQTTDAWSAGRMLHLGRVGTDLPSMDAWPQALRSRNNQLALAALKQIRPAVDRAIAQYGAANIGVVIGTSTSGVAETERALRQYQVAGKLPDDFHYAQQEMGSPAEMLAREMGVGGPVYVHSSACSSSAKALASAARLINMGLCDAVLCGGVDSLCAFTVAGFSALESVSAARCNPLSANRNGINIGEGAALFLMTREPAAVALRGWGESSDGHHMSAPDPAGGGARLSMTQALRRAGIEAAQIEYINLHGTATVQNDAMESRAVHDLFGGAVAVSSTKPFTGHALGAAAAIEAALCWLAMQEVNDSGLLPPHLWDGALDHASGIECGRARNPSGATHRMGVEQFVRVRRIECDAGLREGQMTMQTLPDIRSLVPHAGPMVLLDRVLTVDEETLCAEVTIGRDSLFCDGREVGAWVGVEYMAQAIAAHAGYTARLRGEAVKIGFLLGSRRYECSRPGFAVGSVLHVHVQRVLQGENGLAAFECRIVDADDSSCVPAAKATVTVFQPENVVEFMNGRNEGGI